MIIILLIKNVRKFNYTRTALRYARLRPSGAIDVGRRPGTQMFTTAAPRTVCRAARRDVCGELLPQKYATPVTRV